MKSVGQSVREHQITCILPRTLEIDGEKQDARGVTIRDVWVNLGHRIHN
jgi:hypothetical protein